MYIAYGEERYNPRDKFQEFYKQFVDENNEFPYVRELERMEVEELRSIIINYEHLMDFDMRLASDLLKSPQEIINIASRALEEVIRENAETQDVEDYTGRFYARFHTIPRLVSLRELRAEHLDQLILVEGILVRTTKVRPLLAKAYYLCKECGEGIFKESVNGKISAPKECLAPECKSSKFTYIQEQSVFIDWQGVTIQERPELLPAGQIPRSIYCHLLDDLVDIVSAGDRVICTGMLKLVPKKREEEDAVSTFDVFMSVNYITGIHQELDVDTLTSEEIDTILELGKDPNIHLKLLRSLAPSIWGMEVEKEGICLMIFGGRDKILPDGIRLRGQSNVLLIGDPGTAKSQMLTYVHNLAPRSLFTSGKSSSAAGLTAAVIRDSDTGDFTLEAGALVLADRGIACIDEFDKISSRDRSSIHEAMEQQSFHFNTNITIKDDLGKLHTIKIGEYVDQLFAENKEKIIPGVDCEILEIENKHHMYTTNFSRIYLREIARISRHIAPDSFFQVKTKSGARVLVTPCHPVFLIHRGQICTVDAEFVQPNTIIPVPAKSMSRIHDEDSIRSKGEVEANQELVIPYTVLEHIYAMFESLASKPIELEEKMRQIERIVKDSCKIDLKHTYETQIRQRKLIEEVWRNETLFINIKRDFFLEVVRSIEKNLVISLFKSEQVWEESDQNYKVKKREEWNVESYKEFKSPLNYILYMYLLHEERERKGYKQFVKRTQFQEWVEENQSNKTLAYIIQAGYSRTFGVQYENNPVLGQRYRYILSTFWRETYLQMLSQFEEMINLLFNQQLTYTTISETMEIPNTGVHLAKYVYDVTIEPEHSFLSSDLILHNTVSIAKAGIVATLNARTSILAAANPRFGRYEVARTASENINLPPTILSRFDLIFIIRDKPQPDADAIKTEHILGLHRLEALDLEDPPISEELFRKYVAYAKLNVHPQLTKEASDVLRDYYLKIRGSSDDLMGTVAITSRQLEALVRLSESRARMALRDRVYVEDAETVIKIMEVSLRLAGIDPETGLQDIDVIMTGTSRSAGQRRVGVLELIENMVKERSGEPVTRLEIEAKAANIEISSGVFDRIFEGLKNDGTIYEPTSGYFAPTNRR